MLRQITAAGLALCLMICATACAKEPDEIRVADKGGTDITAEALALWEKANQIYNVDDSELLAVDWSAPVLLFGDAPAYFERPGSEPVVDAVFSQAGRAQPEPTKIGGPHPFMS